MDKKSKLIIFVLIFLFLGMSFFAFSVFNSKELLKKEFESTKQKLQEENLALAQKASQALEEKRDLQIRLQEIERQLDNLFKEKQELERRYDIVVHEKETLIEKLKNITTTLNTHPSTQPTPIQKPEFDDAYWAGILKEKTDLEIQTGQLRQELSSLKTQLDSLKNIAQEKQELEKKLSYTEKLVDSLSMELVKEKRDKRKIEEELNLLKNEHRVVINRINALNEEKINLEKKIQQIENEKDELARRLKEVGLAVEKKLSEEEKPKERYTGLESSSKSAVELPPIVVRSQEQAEKVTLKEEKAEVHLGKVLAINKEYNFVVIDLGEEQGVKIGDVFVVYRDNHKIAEIEVIQIRKNVSACDIREQTASIKIGDIVNLRK